MIPAFQPERRICMVKYIEGNAMKEKRAFFHLFTTSAYTVEPSPLKGGHPGGQISTPCAIVEYENGEVVLVTADSVRFLDTEELMKQYSWGEKEEP